MNPLTAKTAASNSSLEQVSLSNRVEEWCAHFGMRARGMLSTPDFRNIFETIDEYDDLLKEFSGRRLPESKVLEAGFGARPLRLIAMTSMGIDIRGVDLDAPILDGSIREFAMVGRRNGGQRLLKSLVRHFLFDRHERGHLRRALAARGFVFRIDSSRFLNADLGSKEVAARIPESSLDLIVSEDVFEHIPPAAVACTVRNMARWLKPDGIAAIRPHVFTGIGGGHCVEWYPHLVNRQTPRRSAPWEHLRQDRFPANTYLNRLRIRNYREAFQTHFEILSEVRADPDLGIQYLTDEVQGELSAYSREELLTNHLMFVLRPRRG